MSEEVRGMADAVERIEAKVEATLMQATAQRRLPVAIGSLIIGGLLLALATANLILYTVDIHARRVYRQEINQHIQWEDRQLTGIACLLLTAPADRGIKDAVRCQVEYVPGSQPEPK